MSANINPICIGIPNTGFTGALTVGNPAMDGSGTLSLLFTAGANGSFIRRIRIKALGTNSSANVIKIFINNGGPVGTPTNNTIWGEQPVGISTQNNTGATSSDYDYLMNLVLKAGYAIYVCIGTSATPGWVASCEGGDY